MVDREARNRYAELLRQFISGRITNDEYEACYDVIQQNEDDIAIGEIYHQIWFLYDDIQTHKMTGVHRLDREGRRTIAQIVLFLKSGGNYPWPKDNMLGMSLILWLVLIGILSALLTSLLPSQMLLIIVAALVIALSLISYYGLLTIAQNRAWEAQGDKEAWPFLYQADLEAAARHPRLLNGKQ